MIKTANVTRYNQIRLVDTFRPVITTQNNGKPAADIYFGSNMDVLVIVAHNKKLSRDNMERIRILTDVRE